MPGWLIKFAPQLLALVVVAALTGGAYRWAWQRGAEAERARCEDSTRQAAQAFSAALMDQQQQIADAEARLGAARRSANAAREGLADAMANDPASRDWAAGAVPDRLRVILSAGGSAVPADPSSADR